LTCILGGKHLQKNDCEDAVRNAEDALNIKENTRKIHYLNQKTKVVIFDPDYQNRRRIAYNI